MSKVEEIWKHFLELSPEEQEQFRLLFGDPRIPDPPGEEISAEQWKREWHAEIKRRSERHHRGATTTQDAFKALDAAKGRLRKRRAQ